MKKITNILLGFLIALIFTTTSYSRDQIKIVGSSTVYPYATVVAEKFGKSLIGYQPRKYLENLGLDDSSQVKFYQGMIKEKITKKLLWL